MDVDCCWFLIVWVDYPILSVDSQNLCCFAFDSMGWISNELSDLCLVDWLIITCWLLLIVLVDYQILSVDGQNLIADSVSHQLGSCLSAGSDRDTTSPTRFGRGGDFFKFSFFTSRLVGVLDITKCEKFLFEDAQGFFAPNAFHGSTGCRRWSLRWAFTLVQSPWAKHCMASTENWIGPSVWQLQSKPWFPKHQTGWDPIHKGSKDTIDHGTCFENVRNALLHRSSHRIHNGFTCKITTFWPKNRFCPRFSEVAGVIGQKLPRLSRSRRKPSQPWQ